MAVNQSYSNAQPRKRSQHRTSGYQYSLDLAKEIDTMWLINLGERVPKFAKALSTHVIQDYRDQSTRQAEEMARIQEQSVRWMKKYECANKLLKEHWRVWQSPARGEVRSYVRLARVVRR